MNVNSFLKSCRTRLTALIHTANPSQPHLHVVMGNESADLDSIVCSITYAYFSQWKSNQAEKAAAQEDLFFPLINIPRIDFPLRTEVVKAFQMCNISPEDLIFVDDPVLTQQQPQQLQIPILEIMTSQSRTNPILDLILVDHNALCYKQAHLLPYVREVVDHHKDENLYKDRTEEIKIRIDPVGSCATLVGELILKHGKS